jgi:hypothetical protein
MINVYLICAEIDNRKLYKIGYTRRSIDDRIREFKTGNASSFYVIDTFQSKWGTKIEARLKKIFKQKKINGEWFDLNDDDIKEFRKLSQSINDILELISSTNTYVLDRGGRF